MKKIIIVGVILLLLASCVTQKRCFQKFPPQIITKDSIILKDTTIYVPVTYTVPGDSVIIKDSIPCPDVQYKKEIKSSSGRTKVEVEISKGKLKVDCKVDSLNNVIDSLAVKLKTVESYKSQVKIVEKAVIKKVVPLWCWILLGVVILYLISPLIIKAIKK